jgi:hypothetical protein
MSWSCTAFTYLGISPIGTASPQQRGIVVLLAVSVSLINSERYLGQRCLARQQLPSAGA